MRPSPFLPPPPATSPHWPSSPRCWPRWRPATRPSDAAYGLVAVGGFLLGTTIRQSALRAEQAELRLADMERAEIERSKAAHLAERADAAREIHDILAHNLGALIVQLDAVNALMEGDHPNLDAIRPVLRAAHQHAVDGLAEARVRRQQPAGGHQAAGRSRSVSSPRATPAPRWQISGPPRAVPADVALMVRRIVQEAMTNAAKHAPGSPVAVQVDFRAEPPGRDRHRRRASARRRAERPGRHGRRLRAGGDARAGRADRGPPHRRARKVAGGKST